MNDRRHIIKFCLLFLLFSCVSSPTDHFKKGVSLMEQGDFKAAKEHLDLAIERDSTYADAYKERSYIHTLSGNNIEATRDNFKASQLYSDKGYDLYFKYHKSEDAFNLITKAIKIFPQNEQAYYNRAEIELYLNDNKGAIIDLDQAEKLGFRKAILYNNRAVAKQHLRMNKEAVIDAQKAIEIDSSYSDAYITLGLTLLNLDRTNEGCAVLRKAAQLGNKKAFEYISEACQK